MVIFYGYVKLPKGKPKQFHWNLNDLTLWVSLLQSSTAQVRAAQERTAALDAEDEKNVRNEEVCHWGR